MGKPTDESDALLRLCQAATEERHRPLAEAFAKGPDAVLFDARAKGAGADCRASAPLAATVYSLERCVALPVGRHLQRKSWKPSRPSTRYSHPAGSPAARSFRKRQASAREISTLVGSIRVRSQPIPSAVIA